MKVKFMSGGYIGVIEEWFISRLEPAMYLHWQEETELVMIKDMTVLVRKSKSKNRLFQAGGRTIAACQPSLGKVC